MKNHVPKFSAFLSPCFKIRNVDGILPSPKLPLYKQWSSMRISLHTCPSPIEVLVESHAVQQSLYPRPQCWPPQRALDTNPEAWNNEGHAWPHVASVRIRLHTQASDPSRVSLSLLMATSSISHNEYFLWTERWCPPTFQSVGIWRWGLFKTRGFDEVMKVEAWSDGVSAFIRRDTDVLSLYIHNKERPCDHTVRWWSLKSQGKKPQDETCLLRTLILHLIVYRTVRNNFLLLSHPLLVFSDGSRSWIKHLTGSRITQGPFLNCRSGVYISSQLNHNLWGMTESKFLRKHNFKTCLDGLQLSILDTFEN